MSVAACRRCMPHTHKTLHRYVHDYIRSRSERGVHARIPLRPGTTFGAVMSRGDRARQEDAMSAACIMLPCEMLRQNILMHVPSGATRDPWYGWTCDEAGGAELAAQVAWFACFDGHGGAHVSQLLQRKLHRVFEAAHPSMVQDTVQYMRSLGGYYGPFQGGVLERWVDPAKLRRPTPSARAAAAAANARSLDELARTAHTTTPGAALEHYVALDTDDGTHTQRYDVSERLATFKCMTMEERATLACLMMDREVQQNEVYQGQGSTASVLLLHSLDIPTQVWYSSEYVAMTTIQLGDTRFVLCDAENGNAIPLTRMHRPDDPTESERLSRHGAGIITDSFGEVRFLGTLANTRSFGDSQAKRYGMTAEPEVQTHIVQSSRVAFIVGFSDGIGDVMSDQEVVDECRLAKHPQDAAKRVIKYAEDLGADDNATVLCVPLRGWGHVGGEDRTAVLRMDRRVNTDLYRDRRN